MAISQIEEAGLNLLANSNAVKKALNADNGAPIYACRAWVNFNGTGTVAIRASGNVSSITDNGIGNYTVNFTTAMPDTNFTVSGFAASGTGLSSFYQCSPWIKDTGSAYVWTGWQGVAADLPYVGIDVHR